MAVPPSWWIPMRTPVNCSTMAGPDTKAKASLVMTTRSARPRRNAGPEMAGPVTTTTTGTAPEHLVSARAACPHPCNETTPSDTSAPLEASTSTIGIRRVRAVRAATRMVSPSSNESAPRRMADTERTTIAGLPPSFSTPARMVPGTSRRKIGAAGASRVTAPCYGCIGAIVGFCRW